MPEVPLSAEQSRGVSAFARSLVAAARSWGLYPPEHPAVRASVERLLGALTSAASGQVFAFGITPDTLLIDGIPAGGGDGPVAEAAAWLHQRDILRLTFSPDAPLPALQAFLSLLAQDVASVRENGGPARLWAETGHSAIVVEQIDYAHVLEDTDVPHSARTKDDVWRSIVRVVIDRRPTLDDTLQRRMIEIAGDPVAIAELAQELIKPHCAADGSPMLTTQAAAVVAAYRHLIGIVEVMAPERRGEVVQNLAAATANLDSRVIIEMLRGAEEVQPAGATPIKRSLAAAFDDFNVAQLLATTLAIEGQASDRLAEVFDTIASDEPRKRRVLTLTRSLLSESAFGQNDEFSALWSSMEELLLKYNERPFVSAQYKVGLDRMGKRAEAMAAEIPPELQALADSLGQEHVRRLSVTLLIDLLKLEHDASRATEVAQDVAALAEDLILSADYTLALEAVTALAGEAANASSIASEGSRLALDNLAQTPAFVEAAELLGDMTEDEARRFREICQGIGPASIDALRRLLEVEAATVARQRSAVIIRSFGPLAATRLAPLVDSPEWYVRRNVADLLGEIGSAEVVPLLQPLLRGADPRVMRSAVRALSNIDDPAAARCIHTVLRAAAGEQRQAVVAALVAERDARVVPLLVRILDESDPLGVDHAIVLDTLGALASVGTDQAVPSVTALMRRRSWFARRRIRAVKRRSLQALRAIGTVSAQQALTDAATHGDRMLRKLVKSLPATT